MSSTDHTKVKFWFGPEIADAAALGDVELLRRLLKSTCPNLRNQLGGTPLCVASRHNHAEAVQILLHHPDTDPNIPDHTGETPLMKACDQGHSQVLSLLLGDKKRAAKTCTNVQDKDGWSALFFLKNLGMTKKLLKRMDAKGINLRDKDGDTALMVHVGKGRFKIAEAMLKRPGIELRYRNKLGENVLDIAKKKERAKLVTLLTKEMKKRYPAGKDTLSPLLSPRAVFPSKSPTMSPTRSPLPILSPAMLPKTGELPLPALSLSGRPSRTPTFFFPRTGKQPPKPKVRWPVVTVKETRASRVEKPVKLGKIKIHKLRIPEPLHWDAHDSADEWASTTEQSEEEVHWALETAKVVEEKKRKVKKRAKKRSTLADPALSRKIAVPSLHVPMVVPAC